MCSNSFPNTMTSFKYIKQMSHCSPVNTVSIMRSKVARALHGSNDITWNWYNPFLVVNAVFWRSFDSTSTCQYPEQRSIVDNHFAPYIWFKESSILGKGYASLTVTLLSFLKRVESSFFLTSTTPVAHGLLDDSMTYLASMYSMTLSLSSCRWYGTFYISIWCLMRLARP